MPNEHDYEYRGLMATTWDLFRGDTSRWEDKFFYREFVDRYGQPVLDVGCGTGRLMLDYLAEGIDTDGVDNSPEMLALCREKAHARNLAPQLFEQYMEQLDLPRRYRTILVPSSSFQLVTDAQLALQALDRLFAHLELGGVLVMPFHLPWQAGEPTETDWALIGEAQRDDGTLVRRWSRASYDVMNQLEHTEDRYELCRDGTVIASEHHQRSPATRWYSQHQAVQLYAAAGFTNIQVWQGFRHEPATETDTLFTISGVRP